MTWNRTDTRRCYMIELLRGASCIPEVLYRHATTSRAAKQWARTQARQLHATVLAVRLLSLTTERGH